jgi:hypothetical protein
MEVSRQDCRSEPTEVLGRLVLCNDRQAETDANSEELVVHVANVQRAYVVAPRWQAFPHASQVDQVVCLA